VLTSREEAAPSCADNVSPAGDALLMTPKKEVKVYYNTTFKRHLEERQRQTTGKGWNVHRNQMHHKGPTVRPQHSSLEWPQGKIRSRLRSVECTVTEFVTPVNKMVGSFSFHCTVSKSCLCERCRSWLSHQPLRHVQRHD
jgi:hypothetical protein